MPRGTRNDRTPDVKVYVIGGERYTDPRDCPQWSEADYRAWHDGHMTLPMFHDRVRIRRRCNLRGNQPILTAADFGPGHPMHDVILALAPLDGANPIVDCIQALSHVPLNALRIIAEYVPKWEERPTVDELLDISMRVREVSLEMAYLIGHAAKIEDRDLRDRPRKKKRVRL